MNSIFSGLHGSLQEVLAHRLGWSDLREVQSRTYREVAGGKDVMVIAPTAGGQTEAALIPVLDCVLKEGSPGVACLYISPLKALINDQEDRFRSFAVPIGLEVRIWHGDVPRGDRIWEDGEPPHLLMITPESLEVLMGEMGWTMADFSLASELQAAEQSQALCDNNIDAMVYTVGHPSGSIQEATTACDAVLVDVSNAATEKLVAENPYYRTATIPGDP